jgi:hypothetical protein
MDGWFRIDTDRSSKQPHNVVKKGRPAAARGAQPSSSSSEQEEEQKNRGGIRDNSSCACVVCVCAGRAAGRAAGRCFVCRYGRYNPADGSTTEVHAVYEPPQSVDEFGAIEVHPEDADAQARVDAVADGLHLTKVGVMFCHPYRATKSAMSSMEVLFAAEQQLQSCDGDIDAAPNRFVTVVVRQTEDGMADFQACVHACVRACVRARPGGGGEGGWGRRRTLRAVVTSFVQACS